jgi:hypothetical protein
MPEVKLIIKVLPRNTPRHKPIIIPIIISNEFLNRKEHWTWNVVKPMALSLAIKSFSRYMPMLRSLPTIIDNIKMKNMEISIMPSRILPIIDKNAFL